MASFVQKGRGISLSQRLSSMPISGSLKAVTPQPLRQTPFPTPSTCSSNLHPTAENCKGTEKERHELKVSEHLEQFQHQYLSVLNSLANFLITVSPALQIYQRIPLWLLDLFFSCSIHFTCFILGLRDRIIIYNINIDAFTLTPTSSHHCYGAACK